MRNQQRKVGSKLKMKALAAIKEELQLLSTVKYQQSQDSESKISTMSQQHEKCPRRSQNTLQIEKIVKLIARNYEKNQMLTTKDLTELVLNTFPQLSSEKKSIHRRITDCLNSLNPTGLVWYHNRTIIKSPTVNNFKEHELSFPPLFFLHPTLPNHTHLLTFLGDGKCNVSGERLKYAKSQNKKLGLSQTTWEKVKGRLKSQENGVKYEQKNVPAFLNKQEEQDYEYDQVFEPVFFEE